MISRPRTPEEILEGIIWIPAEEAMCGDVLFPNASHIWRDHAGASQDNLGPSPIVHLSLPDEGIINVWVRTASLGDWWHEFYRGQLILIRRDDDEGIPL